MGGWVCACVCARACVCMRACVCVRARARVWVGVWVCGCVGVWVCVRVGGCMRVVCKGIITSTHNKQISRSLNINKCCEPHYHTTIPYRHTKTIHPVNTTGSARVSARARLPDVLAVALLLVLLSPPAYVWGGLEARGRRRNAHAHLYRCVCASVRSIACARDRGEYRCA